MLVGMLLGRTRGVLALGRCLAGQGPLPLPGEWPEVETLAEEHHLSAALWGALVGSQQREQVPTDVAARLARAHRENLVRNLLLRRQAVEAVSALNGAGVEPMLFKGALYLFDDTFTDRGSRMMADLDVVVRSGQLEAAVDALGSLGYVPEPGKPFLHPHELPLFAPGRPAPVELHTELGSPPVPQVIPAQEVWARSELVEGGGVAFRAPSPRDRVIHNVIHAQVQDLNHAVGGLALRQLHTLAALSARQGHRIDWDEIARTMERHGLGEVYRSYVYLARALLHAPVPPAAGPRARLQMAWCLAFLELRWPADVIRNLRFAFGSAYMDHLYAHGGSRFGRARARARHAAHLWRQAGKGNLADVRRRQR